jgi:hypothetical protein
MDRLRQELHVLVPQHGPRQQARFLEDLEAIADAEDGAAFLGEGDDRAHHRLKRAMAPVRR